MVTIPVVTGLKISDYGLFPGDPPGSGIDQVFEPGLTIIAGINGLGKTTLLTAILRCLTGPYDLSGDGAPNQMGVSVPDRPVALKRKPTQFFSQRVADEAESATMTLTVECDGRLLQVTRKMSDLSLVEHSIDREPRQLQGNRPSREASYQADLAGLMRLGSFVDVLLVLHHVILFQEDRPGALWDQNAQRQVLRALFLEGNDATRVAELERAVQSADSQARNIQARITATEAELTEVLKDEVGAEALAARLDAEERLLAADLDEKTRLDTLLEDLELERSRVRLEHEKSKISREEARGSVERLKYSALANLYPSMDETARLVIARILTDQKCLVCDAAATGKREELESVLANGICPACGSPPEQQQNVIGNYKFEQAKLDAVREAARVAEMEVRTKAARLQQIAAIHQATVNKSLKLGRTIEARTAQNRQLRAQLPGSRTSKEIADTLATLRRQQRDWLNRREGKIAELSELLGAKEQLISSKADTVLASFAELTSRLLAEPARLAEVRLKPRYTQAEGAVGDAPLQFPAYQAEMVAANRSGFVRRYDPTDVSESQRELIDLAFRLSLVRAAAPSAPATFIMETPEASLDGLAMERVGGALAEFAYQSSNRLIVTTNLSNAGLVTSLFGGVSNSSKEDDRRWSRLLNLLRVAAPNRALELDRTQYERLLEEAVTGRTGE
ncbi:AAA family ATPase [Sphingosinicella sp. YJ22]|uniref:AAA family ATPase n=1 Tax=Sphingosinicella sp. YJ22 TaxID=1104780 RepID=UPI001407BA93|nr:AAA family ATPase [Sphingosinicella sp. YJ22]